MAITPAIFLDKDGTVLEDVPYNVDPQKMTFARGARSGLARLAILGLPLIVVSNQPGIAMGLFNVAQLQGMVRRLAEMFEEAGASLLDFYYCPHAPTSGEHVGWMEKCDCRKPAPGLLHAAAACHRLDLKGSWLVGDILDDVEAGRRAGCRTVLIDNGNETEWKLNPWRIPHWTVADLDAASLVVQRHSKLVGV